jgi:hypothetical protein
MHLADLARLAFDLVAQDVRLHAGGARQRGRGLERLLRRRDHVHRVAGEARVAGLGVSNAPLSQAAAHRGRHGDGVAREDRQRVGAGGGVGHRRAAGDHLGASPARR